MTIAFHHTDFQLGIADICICMGTEAIDLQSLVEQRFLSRDKSDAINRNGSSRYYRSKDHSPEHLAIDAVLGLLNQATIDPQDIQFLIFTSTVFETTALYPDLIAQRIARATGCLNAKAFSVQHMYCVSPLAAMHLLKAYFVHVTEPAHAIIVCADSMGGVTENLRVLDASGVHSDGAAAILICNTVANYQICDIELFTNVAKFLGRETDGMLVGSSMYFAMITKLIRGMLTRNDVLENAKIELFANNLDLAAWRGIGKILKIPEDQVHFDQQSGHVFGADPFINLKNAGSLSADYCVLAATGVAGTIGAALLRPIYHD
jgi:3-oxoacyl-[acyl-carrier-protein] synthase III